MHPPLSIYPGTCTGFQSPPEEGENLLEVTGVGRCGIVSLWEMSEIHDEGEGEEE